MGAFSLAPGGTGAAKVKANRRTVKVPAAAAPAVRVRGDGVRT
jgi:hypothetical protein